GWFQSSSERTFSERTFTYDGTAGWDTVGDPNAYLNNLAARTLSSPFGNQRYSGTSDSSAVYLMFDVPLTDRLRFIGGARQESTDIRITNNGVPSKPLLADDTLPAFGLVFSLTPQMNFRLNYGKTIARPTFREIANYESYDPSGDEIFVGNPDLERTVVDNYDARWEWFPRPGEVLSVGAFYKQLDKPIEKYLRSLDGGKISSVNREAATVYGLEFEARKTLDFIDPLLDHWSLGGNFSYIQSEVPLTEVELFNKRSANPGTSATRPLYDQSPYIANFDLGYDNPRSGTSASLTLNLTGERIYIALGKGPDIYEQPPMTVDFVATQKLRPGMKLKFTVKNLTDPTFKRTYGADAGAPVYSASRKGRTIGLTLSMDL
ncbi:MAG: TonB-dependent receptor, partial [Limisphaerales bacterium]